MEKEVKKLGKAKITRLVVASFIVLVVLPMLVFCMLYADSRYYALITLAFSLFSLVPFFATIENKEFPLYKLVPVAVMTAIAVAGRAAFFFVPQFKPIVAIIIIAGVMLGSSSGFLCGALSMLISNFLFGQSILTPIQMLGMGLIGYVSGFFGKNKLTSSTVFLCIWGFIASLLYGLITDSFLVLNLGASLTLQDAAKIYYLGLQFSLILAVATVIFLALTTKPLMIKLERIKKKYGENFL